MISQTVEYALRAMCFLATLGDRPGTAGDIAHATRAPRGYLSKVLRTLVCARLIRSVRGRRGGFFLARHASEISLLDIVNAVDPFRSTPSCPLDDPASTRLCPVRRCLNDAATAIERSLRHTPLSSLLDDVSDPPQHRRADPPRPTSGD